MHKLLLSLATLALACTAHSQDWNQLLKTVNTDRAALEYYGYSVDISGDYAIVGSYHDSEDELGANPIAEAGAAFFLERDAMGNWSQVQKVVGADRAISDFFGFDVAIDGTTAVIGAYATSTDAAGVNEPYAGAAYVFDRNPATGLWEETQKITQTVRTFFDLFGTAVDISGDRIVVGCYGEDHDLAEANFLNTAGAAFIFTRNAGVWTQTQKLIAADRSEDANFAASVHLEGDLLAIGAHRDDYDENGGSFKERAGSAYVFQADAGGVWSQVVKVDALDRNAEDRFGWSVSIDANHLAVGAFWQDLDENSTNSVSNTGAVYIFDQTAPGTWTYTQKVTSSPRQNVDLMGISVDLSGNRMAIGVGGEDHDATGVNVFNSGAIYIFEEDATGVWVEMDRATHTDRNNNDELGYNCALQGDLLLAGSSQHNFDVAGANDLNDAGAAYLFEYTPNLCAIDSDDDGLFDCDETTLGTNPFDCDSDNDGLSDGLEVNLAGTDPLNPDTDGDMCTDDLEFHYACPDSQCDPCPLDVSKDGSIGSSDLLLILGAFGSVCP